MKENDPIKVSVIVPVYNTEKYLRRALESVIRQSLSEIEIICIDDGSTDLSLNILKEYATLDHRIRIIRNTDNMGIAYVRNVGVEEARGDYIFFLDSDDELMTEALEELYLCAYNEQLDILLFGAREVYEIKDYIEQKPKMQLGDFESVRNVVCGTELFFRLIEQGAYYSALWNKLFSRTFIQEKNICFQKEILYHEDLLFTFLAILQASRTKAVPNIYYIYYKRAKSITTSDELIGERFKGMVLAYCGMMKFWIGQSDLDRNVAEAVNIYLTSLYQYIKNNYGDKEEINNIKFSDPVAEHIYEIFLMDKKNVLSNKQYEISKAEKIIIYGAGKVAETVIRNLDRDKILGIAVSKVCDNYQRKSGFPIKEIGDYYEYKKEALVIVATVKLHHRAIVKRLHMEGFQKILLL